MNRRFPSSDALLLLQFHSNHAVEHMGQWLLYVVKSVIYMLVDVAGENLITVTHTIAQEERRHSYVVARSSSWPAKSYWRYPTCRIDYQARQTL